jgi:hypothetical protein
MDVEAEFEPVIKMWGSEEAIYGFLESEFDRINRECFGAQLRRPEVELRPMSVAPLSGALHGGADYEPAEGGWPSRIVLYYIMLRDRKDTQTAFVHEMIHHWEVTSRERESESDYPEAIDDVIRERFLKSGREGGWRSRHSCRFISKACQIADCLRMPVKHLLFKC